MKRLIHGGVVALLALLLLSLATPAQARISAGPLSLKVTAKCSAPGDTIKQLSIWTPERGNQKVTFPKNQTKTAAISTGTINKKQSGDTFFNWRVICHISGNSGEHQKKYGGSWNGTSYSFTIDKGYQLKKP
ncbi:MAG: hypothetical protein QM621_02210 [Aeromicrobium sp.]|uniref:hypothetical protein n=1 Tax=Aeromicrobium sp. TaxID=1871063 RepID=UPI0039E57166